MFKRPGKHLKILAMVIFWFFIVEGIVIGAVGVLLLNSGSPVMQDVVLEIDNIYLASALVMLVPLVTGVLVGWVNSILLYAFGSIADDLAYLREDVEDIKNYTASQALRGGGQAAGKPTWMN